MAMFDVSVIIASVESARSIERCIESVRAALEGKSSEVIVVDASRDTSADIAERHFGHAVVVIRCAPGTLTPELWAIGIRRSTGRVIALTTGHFEVAEAWVENLESALRAGHTGAAGRLDLADATSVTDWAVFYLRYSEFLQEPKEVWRGVPGIPADNAAYDGEAIRQFVMNSDDGFWEVEFHRQLHAAGGSLAVVPGATARYARSFPFPTIARHRFHHGRHAGAWRASRAGRSAAMIVAGTPLVPFALALRAWRRVRPMVEHRGRFLRALPAFLVLAGCWAVGEAVGAIGGAPAPSGPVPRPA